MAIFYRELLCFGGLFFERFYNAVHVALEDLFDIVPLFADAMVGDAVVGEVIGADFFGTVAGAHLFAAQVGDGARGAALLDFIELGSQDIHRFFPVCVLGAFFAGGNDDAGRFVEDADGSLHFVHVLSARAAGAGEGDFEIIGRNVYFFGFNDGEDGNGSGRRVHAAGFFGFRDALDAVHSRLVLEGFINAFALHFCDERLISLEGVLVGIKYGKSPASFGRVALVHAGEIAGKKRGFVASRARPDFNNYFVRGHISICYYNNETMANQPLILIADDDAAFREIFSTKLSAEGYRIETAEDGKIAVQKTQALKPDLVLMDVNMPVMDGAAATLAIRAIPEIKDTKIAFLTSLGDPQLEVQNFNSNISKNFGAQGYLRKTDDLDSLAAQIKQFLL